MHPESLVRAPGARFDFDALIEAMSTPTIVRLS